MNTNQTLEQMKELKLAGMAASYSSQLNLPVNLSISRKTSHVPEENQPEEMIERFTITLSSPLKLLKP
jgi:hypothetical protein